MCAERWWSACGYIALRPDRRVSGNLISAKEPLRREQDGWQSRHEVIQISAPTWSHYRWAKWSRAHCSDECIPWWTLGYYTAITPGSIWWARSALKYISLHLRLERQRPVLLHTQVFGKKEELFYFWWVARFLFLLFSFECVSWTWASRKDDVGI